SKRDWSSDVCSSDLPAKRCGNSVEQGSSQLRQGKGRHDGVGDKTFLGGQPPEMQLRKYFKKMQRYCLFCAVSLHFYVQKKQSFRSEERRVANKKTYI